MVRINCWRNWKAKRRWGKGIIWRLWYWGKYIYWSRKSFSNSGRCSQKRS